MTIASKRTSKKTSRFALSKKKKYLIDLLSAMSVSEKIILGFFVSLMCLSALFGLQMASNAMSIEVPVEGGDIYEGVVGYPRYINPLLSVTDAGRDLSLLVYSGLMKANNRGTLDFDLARDYTLSEDGLTYHFYLKDDITFHDNVPVTAYDVEFTIKKALDPVIKSPRAANWEGVEITVINDKEIEFVLRHPYAPFVDNLTLGIIPKHIWENVDSDGYLFSQFNFEPIGSGPYRIQRISRNAAGLPEYYHLTPFENYALGKPYIANIYMYFFTNESDLLTAYENGIVTSMSSVSPEAAQKISETHDGILRSPLPRIYGIFFNQNQATLFTNLEVKRALREAVPRKEVIDNVLKGFAAPINGPLPYQYSSLSVAEQSTEEGIAKAKEILANAGWKPNADGILEKKTSTSNTLLSFSISTSNSPELKDAAMIVKETWEKIGARVDVKVFDISDLNQNVIFPRNYDALLFGESVGRNLDLYSFWHSSERNDPGLNVALYTSTKADELLTSARSAADFDRRLDLYHQFEKEVDKDIPAIFLYSPELIYIIPENLQGISLDGVTNVSERFLGVEHWYVASEKIWPLWQMVRNWNN